MKKLSNRKFTRSDASVKVCVTGPEEGSGVSAPIEGISQDLSMNGLYMQCASPLPVGIACSISLVLDGGQEDIHLSLKGNVARSDAKGMAISFSQIEDDSLEHLRKLILYNSEETEKTEQEFEEHVGLRVRSASKQF